MTSAPTRTVVLVAVLCLVASAVGFPAVALATDLASTASSADVTYVESDVTEDTAWTPEGGPYRVVADVTVEEGATLRVAPGTTVQLAADIAIVVEGNLSADGTASDPVTFTTAAQAPDDVRWASIRYEGTSRSHLALADVTVEKARNAITVGSSAGRVEVDRATVRHVSRNGIQVVNATGTPRLTVERSSFTDVGERGVAVAPGNGAVGGTSVTSNSSVPGNRTEHQLELTPGADVTMDSFRVAYRGHGNVDEVVRGSFRRFGLDRNGNGTVDQSLLPLVESVERPEPNAFEIRLARPVTVPADATVMAAYDDATNPATFGTYPVAVGFRRNSVEQTATATVPFTLRSSGDQRQQGSMESHASGFVVRDSTFESIGQQGVFVAADATHGVRLRDNTFAEVDGSGISLRGQRVESVALDGNRIAAGGPIGDGVRVAGRGVLDLRFRRNRISGADAGVHLVARRGNVDGVRFVSNVVTGSATGVRVDHRGTYYPKHLSLALADNEITGNDRRGVSITTTSTRVRNVTVTGNLVADNGDAGLVLEGDVLAHATVRNNTVETNGDDGVRLDAMRFVHATVADNRLAENRGDGLAARADLFAHDVLVATNRVLDNAGVGLDVDSALTHAGAVNLTRNLVAANAYGIRVAGAFGGRIRNNTVVYNTYDDAAPVRTGGYRPGTGIVVEEGDEGAIFRTEDVDEELAELVDDPQVERVLDRRSPGEYTVVLRPGKRGYVRENDDGALAVRSLSEDIPTGVVLQKDDDQRSGLVVRNNDVYGHRRGMTVDVSTLVDANTTTRLLVNSTRTVVAERNYWGAPDGPTHSSIHPEGTGDRVVTRRGWVDFVPPASSPFGPRYHRPVANVTVSPDPATVGERVRVSGEESSDADGRVSTYTFFTPDTRPDSTGPNVTVSSDPATTASFPENGTYTVALAVEDDLGIDGARTATATVAVRRETTTPNTTPTTTPTTRAGNSSTGTGNDGDGDDGDAADGRDLRPSVALFSTLGGLVGLAFYGAALVVGAYGMVRTFLRAGVPVGGKTINGLAAAGVLVWTGAGLLGTDGLLAVAAGGGLVWVALVVLLWAVTRRLFD